MTEQIRLALIKEHKRDKKLTYIAYGLIAVIIIAVLGFFGRIIFNAIFAGDVPEYVRYVLIIAILFYLGFAASKLLKLNKREKEIDELFQKLAAGSKAMNVNSYKEYRIIIPLGKITYKMYPVEFQMFTLDCSPSKPYKLPVHPAVAPEFLKLLSGANIAAVNEHLSELYSDATPNSSQNASTETFEMMREQEAFEDTPMKSVEEYREFLKTELSDTVEAVDENQKKSRMLTRTFGIAAVAVVVGFMAYIFYNVFTAGESFSVNNVFIIMGVLMVGYFIVYFLFLKPKIAKAYPGMNANEMVHSPQYEFKTKILPRIIQYINPGAQYLMHGHISLSEIMSSGMFNDGRYKVTGNDMIIGRYRGVPYQFCDLTVEVEKRVTRENDSVDYAFCGQYFTAKFNKSFSSPVYIIPRTGLKGFFTDNSASVHISGSGEKIQLEDPDFMKMFNVYGTDQIESRYIMTPAMMERIKQLAIRTKGQYYISFNENRITVANNSGKNNLEMGSKSLANNDYKTLVGFYEELADQFSVIDDLKLNIKIWK